MYTRVTKDQFEIRDGVYIHTPTEAEFAPNPNSEGSMVIYTGNIGSKLASSDLFGYDDVPKVMKALWEQASRDCDYDQAGAILRKLAERGSPKIFIERRY
jgi:hypothetical protein